MMDHGKIVEGRRAHLEETEILGTCESIGGVARLQNFCCTDILESTTETMTSMSKHQQPVKKVNSGDREDRISNLTDSLLIHILSFLPTKISVQTSVLSPRWKDLWSFVPNLDFDGPVTPCSKTAPECHTNFMNFVDYVLLFHNLPCLERFRLRAPAGIDVSRLHTWINDAIRRRVKDLDLIMYPPYTLSLPPELFTCKTLIFFRLLCKLDSDFPSSVYFPNLKVLYVALLYPGSDITQRLFTSCPKLEDLNIRALVNIEEEIIFNIFTPFLRILKIELRESLQHGRSQRGVIFAKKKIVVNAPLVQHLTVKDDFLAGYMLKNLCSLVEAHIDVGCCCKKVFGRYHDANQLFMLLNGITNVKFLSLTSATVEALNDADDKYKLPLFPNLTCLELGVHTFNVCRRVPDFLARAPKLVTLVLNKDPSPDERGYFLSEFNWIEPQQTPTCLLSHLEEIQIFGFEGVDEELKMLKYLLENAKVLKKLRIECYHLGLGCEENFLKHLSMIRMGSQTCKTDLLFRV